MVSKTVIDVILGEAGGKSRSERYSDMLAVASVIQNRADKLGVTPEDVVSVPSEFNAYGKTLPAGTEGLRNVAEQAWADVQTHGPVHGATFYATPAAKENLPSGLTEETKTGSHVYFSDPQGRAIRTAQGFVAPTKATLPQVAPVPVPSPAPAARTIEPGRGLANLVPNERGTPISAYDMEGLHPTTQALMGELTRAGFGDVGVNSGYRSPSRNARAGGASRSRHMSGRAVDLATAGMTEALRGALLEAGIVNGNAKGIGLYPSGNVHMDTRRNPAVWGPGRNAYAGVDIEDVPEYARPIIGDMLNAGPYGVTPRTEPPTPSERPAYTPNSPAVGARAASELQGYRSPAEQARFDSYAAYGRSRSAPGARPATTDAAVSGRTGVSATGAGSASLAPPVLPEIAPIPFGPQMAAVDPLTTKAVPTPTPAPRNASLPSMATNDPIERGFPAPPPQMGFPAPPPSPQSRRNREVARGALVGLAKGGIPGAIIGAIAAPIGRQIRDNVRHNRFAPPIERVGVLRGLASALNPMANAGIPAPTHSLGSGVRAMQSVYSGAPVGAIAYSRSNPNISIQSLGNGLAYRSNSQFPNASYVVNTGRAPSAPSQTLGGFFSGLFSGDKDAPSSKSGKK